MWKRTNCWNFTAIFLDPGLLSENEVDGREQEWWKIEEKATNQQKQTRIIKTAPIFGRHRLGKKSNFGRTLCSTTSIMYLFHNRIIL
jgi:hypothetical protein